ncbi:four helix bundle protein [Patescibacteria group bacterium]|nr:four helix bundle protein [Patescibacteria group bacterium]
MHRFVKLEVYQKALKFTGEVYKFSNLLPDDERFGIVSQLRRATTSIVLNIAEGAGAGSDMEFKRFLRMSLRSTYEVNSIFDIIKELGLSDLESVENLRKNLDEISAMIFGLIKSLNN